MSSLPQNGQANKPLESTSGTLVLFSILIGSVADPWRSPEMFLEPLLRSKRCRRRGSLKSDLSPFACIGSMPSCPSPRFDKRCLHLIRLENNTKQIDHLGFLRSRDSIGSHTASLLAYILGSSSGRLFFGVLLNISQSVGFLPSFLLVGPPR